MKLPLFLKEIENENTYNIMILMAKFLFVGDGVYQEVVQAHGG